MVREVSCVNSMMGKLGSDDEGQDTRSSYIAAKMDIKGKLDQQVSGGRLAFRASWSSMRKARWCQIASPVSPRF